MLFEVNGIQKNIEKIHPLKKTKTEQKITRKRGWNKIKSTNGKSKLE